MNPVRLPSMSTKKVEDGIRRYLESLGQSNKPVVDREAVKALKAQIRVEGDVINKAKLLSELEREEAGRVPDFSGDEAVFVAEAKAWADDAGVSGAALLSVGVPAEVLRRAGFEVKATTTGASRRSGATGSRAPAIPIEEVAVVARKLGSGWKIADLAKALDREPMTVRNYVTKLVEQKVISDLGEDPKHDGRGRAPKIYGIR